MERCQSQGCADNSCLGGNFLGCCGEKLSRFLPRMSVRICLVSCPAVTGRRGNFLLSASPASVLCSPHPCFGMLLLLSMEISAGLKANPISSGSHPHQGGGRSANNTPKKKNPLNIPLVWLVFPPRARIPLFYMGFDVWLQQAEEKCQGCPFSSIPLGFGCFISAAQEHCTPNCCFLLLINQTHGFLA